MKKRLAVVVAGILAVSSVASPMGSVVAFGDTTLPESYMSGMDPVESTIAQAVYQGYNDVAPTLKGKVVEFARPKLSEIGKEVYSKMAANKADFDRITYRKPSLAGQIPDQATVSKLELLKTMMPSLYTSTREKVRGEIIASIRNSFATIPNEVDLAVRASLAKVSPIILADVKPYIKEIVYSTGDLIDGTITDSIDAEIEKALPAVLEQLPDDFDGMDPADIAERFREKMEPAAQAALRPSMEIEIKDVINAQVEELVEKPIGELMDPKIDSMDDDAIYEIMQQIPSYVNGIITNAEIKAVVDEEMANLKAKLPAMIDSEQAEMKNNIKKEIEKFIDDNTKLYVDGQMSNLKLKIMKSRAFINYTDLKKALGATTTYNAKKKSITVKTAGKTIEFGLKSDDIKVDGKLLKDALEAAEVPTLNGKIPALPMEVVSKQLGYDFSFSPEWGMTTVDKK